MRSWVIFLLSVGCSDTSLLKGEDGLACGDGTIEQDGECVPEGESEADTGDDTPDDADAIPTHGRGSSISRWRCGR